MDGDALQNLHDWHMTISGANTSENLNARASTHVIKRLTNETGLVFAVSPADPTAASTRLSGEQVANVRAMLAAMDATQKIAAFGRILVYSVNEEKSELEVYNIPVSRLDPQAILAVERVKAEMAGNGKRGPVLRGMLAGDMDAVKAGLDYTGPVVERQDAPVAEALDTRTEAQKATSARLEEAKPLGAVVNAIKYPFSIFGSRPREPAPPDYADEYKKFLAEEERTGKSIEQPR